MIVTERPGGAVGLGAAGGVAAAGLRGGASVAVDALIVRATTVNSPQSRK